MLIMNKITIRKSIEKDFYLPFIFESDSQGLTGIFEVDGKLHYQNKLKGELITDKIISEDEAKKLIQEEFYCFLEQRSYR